MQRSSLPEITDNPDLPEHVLDRFYRDLTRVHKWLGSTAAILRALRAHPYPLRTVLDIGCGRGDLLLEVQRALGVDVVGIDLRALSRPAPVPILNGNAVRTPLPQSDAALAVGLIHHLSEADFVRLLHNVARSSRRLIVLDYVRHRIPLSLFRVGVFPFLHAVAASDGMQTIRRSYTPAELAQVVRKALAGTGALVHHSVAPLYMRQMVDITFHH